MKEEDGSDDRGEIQHQRIVALDMRQFVECNRAQLRNRKPIGESMWECNHRMEGEISQRSMKIVDFNDHTSALEAYLLARGFEYVGYAWIGDDLAFTGVLTQAKSTQTDKPKQDRQATCIGERRGGPWIPLCGNTGDPWIQDQIEVGFHSAPGYGWNPVVLNSPRDRTLGCFFVDGADFRVPGLTLFAETQLLGPDFGFVGTIGGIDTTQDSFGNLEAFGPLFNHPVGLIYHGNGLQAPIQTFLNQQAVQAPTPDGVIDTSWLLVQHVDEIVSIDAFNNIAYVANPLLGMIILILEDPDYLFDQGQLWHWNQDPLTASELLTDYGELNGLADVQIQVVRDRLNNLGYQVISFPVFFFFRDEYPEFSTAALPNMVNMLNVDGTLIVPEPFYQPFKDALLDAVLPGTPVEWIDCLEMHWRDGEVHCATGTIRWPSEEILQWWLHEPTN